jgi:hypothetical protein
MQEEWRSSSGGVSWVLVLLALSLGYMHFHTLLVGQR